MSEGGPHAAPWATLSDVRRIVREMIAGTTIRTVYRSPHEAHVQELVPPSDPPSQPTPESMELGAPIPLVERIEAILNDSHAQRHPWRRIPKVLLEEAIATLEGQLHGCLSVAGEGQEPLPNTVRALVRMLRQEVREMIAETKWQVVDDDSLRGFHVRLVPPPEPTDCPDSGPAKDAAPSQGVEQRQATAPQRGTAAGALSADTEDSIANLAYARAALDVIRTLLDAPEAK